MSRRTLNDAFLILWLLVCGIRLVTVTAFTTKTTSRGIASVISSRQLPSIALQLSSVKKDVEEEVAELLSRAKAIRDSLPPESKVDKSTIDPTSNSQKSDGQPSISYRLHIDIGREDGTWMDPKWGATGNRIEFTIDVDFLLPNDDSKEDASLAAEDIRQKMVKDNLSGKSTAVRIVQCPSESARLRGCFDKMKCDGGGYRIDLDSNKGSRFSSSTARFFLDVEGTKDGEYGEISIPSGCLYFSLPCFQQSIKQLSKKEGIVTVRQMGWHTGWRRLESRIVGTFRAQSL
mmetsp:Transcript_9293/g.14312  ORF Transcript_9293/g.14312 Transcript_9293/m.14312 type:complete len:289 (+) Transcript_9293:170-1036(+)